MSNSIKVLIPEETILYKIYRIRSIKVMADRDIALLYGVSTKALNQAVKRNLMRFPEDFMFQLDAEEFENWKSQFVTSNSSVNRMGLRKRPFVFSEQGVAMLAGIINSKTAISVSIQIIRVFVRIRELLQNQVDILQKIEELKMKDLEHDNSIHLIFEYLKQLEQDKQTKTRYQDRIPVGFKINGEP